MAWTRTYTGSEPQRVNKWLAQSGVCSRREAEALITDGLVSVGGKPVTEPGHKIWPGETLTLSDRAEATLADRMTLVMHKPPGYVSGTPEGEQVPAIRLATAANREGDTGMPPGRRSLAPLGRLDQDSRGLLLLSDDGVLAKALIGPRAGVEKDYLVRVEGEITEGRLALLRHGLSLDGRRLKRAQVSHVKGPVLRFVLREGRNRQVRRMCELVGLTVSDLLRTRIGPLKLAGLPEGRWRPLTEAERDAFINPSAG